MTLAAKRVTAAGTVASCPSMYFSKKRHVDLKVGKYSTENTQYNENHASNANEKVLVDSDKKRLPSKHTMNQYKII